MKRILLILVCMLLVGCVSEYNDPFEHDEPDHVEVQDPEDPILIDDDPEIYSIATETITGGFGGGQI